MDIRILVTLLFVTCLVNTSYSQKFHSVVAIQDIAVSSDYVYVADSHALHLLHTNLTHFSNLTMGAGGVLKITLNSDDTFIIVCLLDGLCRTYEIENLLETNSVPFHTSTIAAVPAVRGIALGAPSNSTFYVGSEGYTTNTGRRAIILRQFEYDRSGAHLLRTSEALVTNSSFLRREFYNVLNIKQFIYYISVDTIVEKNRLTVVRVCDEVNDEHFNAVTEVELNCGIITPSFNITYSSLLPNASQTNEALVITTSSRNGSQVCIYHLADIDRELQRVYYECVSTNSKIPLPWADYENTEDCTGFSQLETTECNFGSSRAPSHIPALASRNKISGIILLETSDEITATLSLSLDDILFLYVVHTNSSGQYLTQYHIMNNMTVGIVKMETIDRSTIHHLKHNNEYIYAVTDKEAFIIYKLDDCSLYSDCGSCTKSTPLCGWCTLEGMCSRKTNCQKAHLRNRWIRNSRSCISHIKLLQPHSAVTPLSANVTVIPTTATFPEMDKDEEYNCNFNADAKNYSFTLPLVDGKFCDASATPIPDFVSDQIKLQLVILPQNNSKNFESFTIINTLIMHNCTFNLRCRECAAIGVCGWCIFDNMCMGSSTLCYNSADWRSSSVPSQSRCPTILLPIRGWYLQPAGVSNELKLRTKHLPSLIPGYKYTCELKYPSGLTIITSAINSTPNGSQIQCQIKHNEIVIPEPSITGVMAIQLNLVLTNENRSFVYVVEWGEKYRDGNTYFDENSMEATTTSEPALNQSIYNTLVFNCSYFGHDCSSCIAARSGTDFPCVWCRGDDPDSGKCVQISECFEMVIISGDGAHECPNPQIIYVSPTSGHIDGGTVLTITGSDLGVTVHDVNVLVGSSVCSMLQTQYKPGKEIVCITSGASTQGEVTITVQIRRAQTELISSYNSFNYALPDITSVYPRYGPVSGGTLITISGSALNVGNTENISITISEEHCEIINITNSNLICKTSQTDSYGTGRIFVEYGTARVNGENYLYTPDPIFESIFPHNTIPAGEISLNFTGYNLNSTQNPRMVINIGNNSYINTCRTNENTSLHCSAPRLPSLEYIEATVESQGQKQIREGESNIMLNYTIIMDDSPGPPICKEELHLTVTPNPILIEVQEESRMYHIGSEDAITIIGRYLDTVHITEIKVYLGEYMCKPTSVTSVILQCKPKISTIVTTQMKEIKVVIANNTLEYNLGYIQIIKNDTVDRGNSSSLIIAIATVIVIMILLAITFCVIIIAVYMCIKRKYSRETQLKQMPIQTSYFGGLRNEGGDNIYDHIIEDTPKSINNTAHTERQLNNYLYKTDEDTNPSCNQNVGKNKNTTMRGSLPQIPQDDYVEMQSHCVQLQNRNKKGNIMVYCQCQPSTIGTTGEYVDMLPASAQAGRSSMQHVECKTFSDINEDYMDIEDMGVTDILT